jgi:hypothetical protein
MKGSGLSWRDFLRVAGVAAAMGFATPRLVSGGEAVPDAAGPAKDQTKPYLIRRAEKTPEFTGDWDGPAWKMADVLDIAHFYARSSSHRPVTQAKILYDQDGLYVFFKVKDRYVRSVHTNYQDSTCLDSCVEFFVEPKAGKGYFNFEFNCGGTLLLYFIEDPKITASGFEKYSLVDKSLADLMRVYHSMPATVPQEIESPVEWKIEYSIPFKLFEHYLGALGEVRGQTWRANLYKCGDQTSHPHWASWSPIGDQGSFHQPQCFAPIQFALE